MKRLAGLIPVAALVFSVACGQTDAGITTSVKSKLAADDAVKASQVDVTTQNKVVTLSGRVDTEAAKDRAVTLARETSGVRDVVDNLQVADTAATSGRLDRDNDLTIDDKAAAAARKGADATSDAARRSGDAVAGAARRTGDAVRDSDVDDKAREGGNAIVEGAKKTGEAAKKGAEAVGKGAKKIGTGIRDAVTDDDKDTDKDGK